MGAQKPTRPPPGHAMLLPRVSQDDDTQRALQQIGPAMQQVRAATASLGSDAENVAQIVGSASAIPTSGTWKRGNILLNSAPVAGGFIGWVCVAAGTPGTWKTWGAISP